MQKKNLSLIIAFFLNAIFVAQTSTSLNSSEIVLGLEKLNTVGSVLYIAAHPDDENTRLLSYLANEKKFRTAYLSITRGDGGQNLIGTEQGEPLGLIRTQELLAARRVDGAEQFFTRANDFGYSKNPEETFDFWNKDSILKDVVLTIRKFKPDVIICRFPTTGEGGHGHHTASAILALEAFDAAANPNKFPEQLNYTQVWKTKRIFWNTFNFGTTNTTSPDQHKIDVGMYNALLGKNYGEIAAESRTMHKSQGFGSSKQRGSNIEYFKFLKGDSTKTDVFEGIKTDWTKFNETAHLDKLISECIKNFSPQHPQNSVKSLVDLYKQINNIMSINPNVTYWKEKKLKETENLILACSGLWLEAIASDYSGVPGGNVYLTTQIVSRNLGVIKLNGISYFNQSDTSMILTLNKNELYSFKHTEKIPISLPYSDPYWLNNLHSEGLYNVSDVSLIGKPQNEAAAKVIFKLQIEDLNLDIERDVIYKITDPVKGEFYRPFEVLPPICINISDKVFVFNDNSYKTIQITIKANAPNQKGKLVVNALEGFKVSIQNSEFDLKNKGDEIIIEAKVNSEREMKLSILKAFVLMTGNTYNQSIKRIEYDHIPYQFLLSEATASLIDIDLKKTFTEIGYISGAGDNVAACLKQIGYNVTLLTEEILLNQDLSKYKAIVTGIRAYNTNARLQAHHNKLMDYVKNGGNLLVQYNTNSRVGPLQTKIGPYPFTISRERVTDENANVTFLNDKHPVFNFPNKITKKDFDGWIQERGIYFASEIDKQYESVLSMNDKNEKTNTGSTIIGKYGKGNFVYTGLVFFRELPQGVPGAYRLFVNLISLPKNN